MTFDITPFIRPSSTEENALCPGRPTMQAATVALFGKPKATAEADLGTRAHSWAEAGVRLLAQDMDTCETLDAIRPIEEAMSVLREVHEVDDPADRLDGWSWYVVERYVRFVHGLILKHGIEPANVLVEHRLDVADLGYGNGGAGTSDCILVVPFERVIVVDLKAGFVEQDDATHHAQLSAYGVAAALHFKAETVEVWVAQPRQARDQRFTGATFDAQALRETAAWIRAVNARCRATDPELVAGYRQCNYCAALPHCRAARELIMNASEALAALGKPLDPVAFGELADAAKLAEKFAEAGKAIVKEHLTAGGEAVGWRLGEPRANRFVARPGEAIGKLRDAGLVEDIAAAASLSVSRLSPAALEAIQDHLTEKLSAPPLTQDRRAKTSAA